MKLKRTLLSVLLMLLLATFCRPVSCLAATVNNEEVSVGEQVTYSVYIKPLQKLLAAFNMKISYDSSVLQIAKDGQGAYLASSPGFSSSVINCESDGYVISNAVDGINGFEITEDTKMIEITFNVVADGEAEVSYEMLELFDYDIVDISVSETYDMLETASGDNNIGQSTSNGNNSDEISSQSQGNQAVSSDTASSSKEDDGSGKENLLKDTDDEKSKDGNNTTIVVVIVVISIAVVGALIFVFVSRFLKEQKNSKKNNSKRK